MYERFFGLADAPFRLTPDPRYLFLSRKHADALAHLKLGLSESSGFVCITGDVGTGKTTLLRAFLTGPIPDTATAYVFNPVLSPLELLQTINGEFGLPADTDSRTELVGALNRHLLEQRKAGRRAIVVIDEAQALAVEVLEQLRLLSNLETTTEKLLRIILVGQPQLRTLLLHPELVQLNQRITLRWHIGPLTRQETGAYIQHRLSIASQTQAGPIFTRPALRRIHRLSGGVPRMINMIAHRAMVAAFADDRHTVRTRSVRQAYDEIAVVPLPPRRRPSRVAALATVGAAACLAVIAIGAARLSPPPEPVPLPAAEPAGRPAASAPEAAPPSVAPVPEAQAPGAVPEPAAPPPSAAEEPPSPETATASQAATSPPPQVATAPGQAAPEPPARAEVEQRLAALDTRGSAREALDAVFAAWGVRLLAPREPAEARAFTGAAVRRGLEHLLVSSNGTMLRALDLPAILELNPPDAAGLRYAAVVNLSTTGATLVIGDAAGAVDRAFLDRAWFGRAHVFWRDFDGIGALTGASSGGVRRLQTLLRRAGIYHGPETGVFDEATRVAVLEFQRARFLVADGLPGPLTRILLYDVAGGYPRPTLGAGGGGTS